MAVALIFLACEDETSLLGFPNPNTKFDLRYIEIPLESKVLLLDSVRTSNYVFGGEVNRLLVGQYDDAEFGKVTSSAYMHLIGLSATKLPAGITSEANYDSVSLQLTLDFYRYGSAGSSSQTFGVYELEENLDQANMKWFFNKTETDVKEPLLGSKTFSVIPEELETLQKDGKTMTITVPLEYGYGKRIFDYALRYRDASTKEDSAWFYFDEFLKEFKGLALIPTDGDKIVGFSADATRLNLHYHTATADSLKLSLGITIPGFVYKVSYNNITVERTDTDLAGLTAYDTSISSSLDKRYIQAGAGLVTTVNFQNFLNFADTVQDINIQGATLVIDGVESSDLTPPNFLALLALGDGNVPKKYSGLNEQDNRDAASYKGYLAPDFQSPSSGSRTVVIDNDSTWYIRHDNTSAFNGNVMSYNADDKKYTGAIGGFLQELTGEEAAKTKFLNFAIVPSTPPFGKSVDRAIFNKQNIKLRINYLKPTVNTD